MFFQDELCKTNEAYKVMYFIFKIIEIAMIVIPIGLIVMMSVDYLKNVFAGNTDEMQKNFKISIKRIIYCIIIFLIPMTVRLTLSIISNNTDVDVMNAICVLDTKLKNANFASSEDKEEYKNSKSKTVTQKKDSANYKISNGKNNKKNTKNAKKNKNTNKNKVSTSNKSGADLILANAENYYRKIEKDGNWVHRMDKHKYKHYGGWTECCRLVSHVLIESGYLKKGGYLCHVNGSSSSPKGTSKLINMKVIKTRDTSKLKPGDVIIKNGGSHNIAILAKRKNGKYIVYGASSTNEIRKKSHPASNSWWQRHGINYIVRAKS